MNVIEFMKHKYKFLSISLIFVLFSIYELSVNGLNFGIDFTGGTVVQVKYEQKAPLIKIREVLEQTQKYKGTEVKLFGSESEVVLKIKNSSTSVSSDIGDEIRQLLVPTGSYEIRKVDMVGPKVGEELKTKGLMALGLSLLVILIYVSFRFEYRFAVASVIALFHDVLITAGFIALFDVSVNLDILAAILTIIGYSLNDTIIVFDRIREGLKDSKENKLDKVINESVTNTLSRTTITSLTTFVVVFALFMYGGEILNGFALTLMIGIMVGTYSSIFVAASVLNLLGFSISDYRNNLAQKEKARIEREKYRAQFEQGVV